MFEQIMDGSGRLLARKSKEARADEQSKVDHALILNRKDL